MIDSDGKLEKLLPELEQAPWIAIDTEADSLHSYPENLCLLQISIPGQDELVDTMADFNLSPLWDLLKPRELLLHGADYDLRLFSKHQGFVPDKIFDTMIAARLLGREHFGLANLVKQYLDIDLEKGPQKSDWSKRPLTPRMEEYARNDTRHLQPLVELLRGELEALGRMAWQEESCLRLIADNTRNDPPDPDRVWRIKYSSKLTTPGLAVLREIWKWREAEATRANKPPFYILQHQTLVAIADAAGESHPFDRLIPQRYSQRRRRALLDAIALGQGCPEDQLPGPIRNRGYRASEKEKADFTRLKALRDRRAAELKLDPTLIASKETMEQLTRTDNQAAWDGLMNWQRATLK